MRSQLWAITIGLFGLFFTMIFGSPEVSQHAAFALIGVGIFAFIKTL